MARVFVSVCLIAVVTTSSLSPATVVLAQTISLAPGSPSVPPAPPPGPCAGAFSQYGDIFEPVSGVSVPMGPPGCGLGWPFGPGPANVDAFSSGSGAPPFLPHPPGLVSAAFSVDPLATGDSFGTCTTSAPGPFPPDVASEACARNFSLPPAQASSDAAGDLFLTGPNAGPLGGSLPAPGTMPNFQVSDGDGAPPALGCPFAPPFGTFGLVEPSLPTPGTDPFDDVDALDLAPIAAWDFGPNGVPDVPVYYSVDPATAATSAGVVLPDDVLVALGGGMALYAPGGALGLGPGNDIDALVVMDAFFDGIYAPGLDIVLYSLAPGSAAIGTLDGCTGVPIGAGDILVEGSPLGAPGTICIYMHAADANLWDDATCGPNPVTGAAAGDNIDGFDILPGSPPPVPLCGPAPVPDGSCNLADPSAGGKSLLKIKRKIGTPEKQKLLWKWAKGEAVTTSQFMSPDVGSNNYRLCIYDGSALPQPRMQKSNIPGGITPDCSGKPCWKALGSKGFKYLNKSPGSSAGLSLVLMKEGAATKSKLTVKATGEFINSMDPSTLVSDVVVQLLISDGFTTECFKTSFPGTSGFGAVKKQDAEKFIAKGP